MQKQLYGKITDGKLVIGIDAASGFKPLVFADTPKNFDQETQYITQSDPVENDDHIFLGVDINILPPSDNTYRGMMGI